MNCEIIDQFTTELAKSVLQKLGPELIEFLDSRRVAKEPDPLLTVREIAAQLRIGETTVRQLVETKDLKRVPGILEIRVRQSVVDAFGTTTPTKRK